MERLLSRRPSSAALSFSIPEGVGFDLEIEGIDVRRGGAGRGAAHRQHQPWARNARRLYVKFGVNASRCRPCAVRPGRASR